MQRLTVDSSHIVAIGYDPAEKILEVEFKDSGVYRYLEVPTDIYEGFSRTDSPGQYFYSYISKQYRYRKVEDEEGGPKALAFVTGSARKYAHFKSACEAAGIETEQLELPVDEIQSDDPEKIALAKAKEAFRLARRPVVVNDLFWNILALKGFPGAYAKEVQFWFKPEDWLALLADKKDRTVSCTDTLTYYDGRKHKTFAYTYHGVIVDVPRGKGTSLMQVVQLRGQDKTIAEIEERGGSPMEDQATVWADFAKWYKLQQRLKRI